MSDLLDLKKQKPGLYFAGLFLFLFLLLYGFNLLFIGITSPGNYYSPWLDQHLNYIRSFRHLLLNISARILRSSGFTVYTDDITLLVKSRGGIRLVYSCLGFGVMSFFAAFVIAWPKRTQKKLLFLICGLLLIQVLNVLRFILIALYYKSYPKSIIDHHDLFNIILYLILLGGIYWWVNLREVNSSLK